MLSSIDYYYWLNVTCQCQFAKLAYNNDFCPGSEPSLRIQSFFILAASVIHYIILIALCWLLSFASITSMRLMMKVAASGVGQVWAVGIAATGVRTWPTLPLI